MKIFDKTVLITGSNSFLGIALVNEFYQAGWGVCPRSNKQLDITNEEKIIETIKVCKPDWVINCSELNDLDACEVNQSLALSMNTDGALYLAKNSPRIVYISTHNVFNGDKFDYEFDDSPKPINFYGLTKYLGEEGTKINGNHYIIRTSNLFGLNGLDFASQFCQNELFSNDPCLALPSHSSNITFVNDLAKQIRILVSSTLKYGTYHIVNDGCVSYFGFAERASRLAGVDKEILPITASELGWIAERPKSMVLMNNVGRMRHWSLALEEYLKNLCIPKRSTKIELTH